MTEPSVILNGSWVDNHNTLKEHVNDYFNLLFAEDNLASVDSIQFPLTPSLTERDNRNLCIPVSCYEVKKAVFSMKPLKAPGPDGFQPIFYKK